MKLEIDGLEFEVAEDLYDLPDAPLVINAWEYRIEGRPLWEWIRAFEGLAKWGWLHFVGEAPRSRRSAKLEQLSWLIFDTYAPAIREQLDTVPLFYNYGRIPTPRSRLEDTP